MLPHKGLALYNVHVRMDILVTDILCLQHLLMDNIQHSHLYSIHVRHTVHVQYIIYVITQQPSIQTIVWKGK